MLARQNKSHNELAEVYESLLNVFNSPLSPNVVLDSFRRTGHHTAIANGLVKICMFDFSFADIDL